MSHEVSQFSSEQNDIALNSRNVSPTLTHYSKDKEFAFYDNGSIAHRHKLSSDDPAKKQLGCKQAYYLFIDGKCTKCGIASPK